MTTTIRINAATTQPQRTNARTLDRLPARSSTAAHVLALTDDPQVGSAQLARAVAADPVLAARIMALANSAYYGLSGRVATLSYAIAVIGFQTIRAIAASIAAGLDRPGSVPDGFWEQAALTATAAGLIAPLIGAAPADAFCLGLLHCLGSALLHQQEPIPALCLPVPEQPAVFAEAELERYGQGHAEAGAEVLRAWRFPARFCDLVAAHHEVPLPDAAPLERCLHLARLVADASLRRDVEPKDSAQSLQWLSEGRLSASILPMLIRQARDQSAGLLAGLEPAKQG